MAVRSLTCNQVQQLRLHFDDVKLENKIINKFLVCGIIVSYRDGLSPLKKPIRIIKLKDSTGVCQLQMFESKEWELVADLVR